MRKDSSLIRILRNAALMLTLSTAGSAHAANWLMLQGVEPAAASSRAEVWGFIQAQYERDFSTPNTSVPNTYGTFIPPKLIAPTFDSQSGFNIQRARIGARGANFPLDSNVNYFLLFEVGNNAITAGSPAGFKTTDASVTLNHIPGARVRLGLFKTPGSEEPLQAIHVFDYVSFSEPVNSLLLERFPNRNNIGNIGPQNQEQLRGGVSLNRYNSPVGAFRDTGVQVFDAFDVGDNFELSYAAMIGQGSGLEYSDYDGKQDKYAYMSFEKKLGGSGPKAEGLKFFAWGQWGTRLLDTNNAAPSTTTTSVPVTPANPTGTLVVTNLGVNQKFFDRNRSGLGVKYRHNQFRATAEYIAADGMIFVGPSNPDLGVAGFNGADARARGWYMEGGWFIPNSNYELDLRYDTVASLVGSISEQTFAKWTLGTQYHFNPKTRLMLNYEIRNFQCTGDTTTAGCYNANTNLDGVGNRVSMQMTMIF